jgi:hypothetical protein
VKKLLKVFGLLLSGLLITTTASAYYVDGSVVRDSGGTATGSYTYSDGINTYVGYIGNVNTGLPVPAGVDPWIGTYLLVTDPNNLDQTSSYVQNPSPVFNTGSSQVHWYKFSLGIESELIANYEWNVGITSLTVDFFRESTSDDSVFYTKTFTSAEILSGHFSDTNFAIFEQGEWLMRLTGVGSPDVASSYRVQLVPLPPAALLFISALAGFGVIGRKKAHKT